VNAIGLSGLDGGLLKAQRKSSIRVQQGDRRFVLRDQWTGRATGVNASLLRLLLDQGYLPVLAPLACSESGEMLNVDGDRAAAAYAIALNASQMVILSNVPGLLRDVNLPGSIVRDVPFPNLVDAFALAHGRMRKKVLAAEEALKEGVPWVTIASANVAQPIRNALRGAGTVFHGPQQVGVPA